MTYQLRVPGPTPVPERVRKAMDVPMINHRGPAFAELISECREGLKWAFQTQNEVVVFPASGTGGLEAAVQNMTSPGEKALFVTIGSFGDRFAKLGEVFGADVVRLEYPWGHGADPAEIGQKLDEHPEIRVVFVTHNETSTGVTNDIAPIAKVVKDHDRLIVVDGVSSVSSIDLPSDELGLDVVISGSQKGWMLPPGCAFLSASPTALEFMATTQTPRFYFDIAQELGYELKGQTFTTPAVSILFGLRESLKILREEGLHEVFARHARIARGVRAAVTSLWSWSSSPTPCSSPTPSPRCARRVATKTSTRNCSAPCATSTASRWRGARARWRARSSASDTSATSARTTRWRSSAAWSRAWSRSATSTALWGRSTCCPPRCAISRQPPPSDISRRGG